MIALAELPGEDHYEVSRQLDTYKMIEHESKQISECKTVCVDLFVELHHKLVMTLVNKRPCVNDVFADLSSLIVGCLNVYVDVRN